MTNEGKRKPNRLIKETSPYLLQHAYNPVDWYPWGEEALQKAKAEDKPILVSIGYAACHWCHVMERESFEKDEVAAQMNELFICIKVDREERPDVDHIYMDAVQAISGQGGWPLNMFLTPDAKPFYGGTYFPPAEGYGRPSWMQVLSSVYNAFSTNRAGIEDQAAKLTSFLADSDNNLVTNTQVNTGNGNGKKLFYEKDAATVFEELKKKFDRKNGGFGGSPKFPNTLNIQYLLLYHYYTHNQEALEQGLLSLDKMICGGIYDQLEGGFSRYSTDDHWLAPHFEKMLYDNALLITAMCQAYQLTGNNLYRDTVAQTLSFVANELTSTEGGFYSALDADSEGHEGKYYVWDKAEIEEALGEEASLFCEFYDVTEGGNWEGTNILHVREPLAVFAQKKGLDAIKVYETLSRCREKLLLRRSARIMPGLDDKIILSWNSMMCSAYLKAYETFGKDEYLVVAENNMTFLLENLLAMKDKHPVVQHTYKNGIAKYAAFLDDHALLIEALIDLYESVFDERLLQVAEELAETVIRNFYDEATGQFYFTPVDQADIIVRKKELFDGVTPSGNSTMAYNLLRLTVITGRDDFHDMASRMMKGISTSMLNYSTSFTKWAMVALRYIYPVKEIAVVGPAYAEVSKKIRQAFIPGRILMGMPEKTNSEYPLLQERSTEEETLIYLCENYACRAPYRDVDLFLKEVQHSRL